MVAHLRYFTPVAALAACVFLGCGSAPNGTAGPTGQGGGAATGGTSNGGAAAGGGGGFAGVSNGGGGGIRGSSGSGATGGGTNGMGGTGGTSTANGPTIGGCPLFPADYAYNQDISQVPVDPNSSQYIADLKARTGAINAPQSPSEFVNIVPASQASVSVGWVSSPYGAWGFDDNNQFYYSSGSGVTAPIPSNAVYENMDGSGENHMIVVQQGTCRLFDFYSSHATSATSGWEAMVTWNLTKDEQLPDGVGSTTAAGTPLLAGVIRYDEVQSGAIHHALDIVIPGADIAAYQYVEPAARSGGACGSPYPTDGFPYGGRLRLKPSFDTSNFTGTEALVIVRALQKYGMIVTDDSGYSRSDFRLGPGNWDKSDLAQLSSLTWDDFEVPKMTVVQSRACN